MEASEAIEVLGGLAGNPKLKPSEFMACSWALDLIDRLPKDAEGNPLWINKNVYIDNRDSAIECTSEYPEIVPAGVLAIRLHDEDREGFSITVRDTFGHEYDPETDRIYSSEAALAKPKEGPTDDK